MKNVVISAFLLFIGQVQAQDVATKKAIYYLIQPKAPAHLDMWTVDYDAPFKLHTLECPCLPGNGKPMLSYDEKSGSPLVNQKDLKGLHIISIKELIVLSKKILVDVDTGYDIYLIVPVKNKFRIYKTRLSITQKQNFTDYEIFTPRDTLKIKH